MKIEARSMMGMLLLIFLFNIQGFPQTRSRPADASAYVVSDPVVAAKLDALADRIGEMKTERAEDRKAIQDIQRDMSFGKGAITALLFFGFMSVFNTIIGIMNWKSLKTAAEEKKFVVHPAAKC